MKNDITIKDVVDKWHKTVMGNMHECLIHQREFADMMWKLYEEHNKEEVV